MSLRITMTIGLAAAATTIGLWAHAETVHQNGFQYDGGVVRYKKAETFLLGSAPERKRLTVYTPQARPKLSVRMSETVELTAAGPVATTPKSPAMSVAPAGGAPVVSPPPAEPIPDVKPVVGRPEVKERSALPVIPAAKIPAPEKHTVEVLAIVPPKAGKKAVADQCSPQTIQFKWASTWVPPKKGKALVEELQACGAKQVLVTGYTCDLGNKSVNDRMAQGRAEEVAKILRKAGFEVIQVNGKGEADYVGSNPKHREENRRVVVTLAG